MADAPFRQASGADQGRSGVRRGAILLVVLFGVLGCDYGKPDKQDEQGVDPAAEAERYELVIVDARHDTQTVVAADAAAPPTARLAQGRSSPPEPTIVRTATGPSTGTRQARQGETSPEPVVLDPGGAFVVQVGAFNKPLEAGKLVRELQADGYPAYQVKAPAGEGYRVRIGFFRTRADADRFGRFFHADRKMDYWVDRRHDAK